MSEAPKLCKDCKHARAYWAKRVLSGWKWASCARLSSETVSPVTGERERHVLFDYCYNERGYYGDCGPQGKFWEPRK